MPRNFGAPSHTSITETALSGPWRADAGAAAEPVAGEPRRIFITICWRRWPRSLDIWETEYLQVLEGDNPVKEWTKGTWLSPLLARSTSPSAAASRPPMASGSPPPIRRARDGKTLFPFRRMFLIATAG